MKQFFYSFLLLVTISLTGCFDTKQEITVEEDGKGVFTSTTDMSSIMAMASQMGAGAKDMPKDVSKDTVIALAPFADSIADLSADEKIMLADATMNVKVDMKEEQFVIAYRFPFSKLSDIALLNQLVIKVRNHSIGDQLKSLSEKGSLPGGDMGGMDIKKGDSVARQSEVSDYFVTTYSNGKISSKLNKEKHATIGEDKDLKSLQEMSQLGVPMDFTYVINLPRPATKAEGKALKTSEDKKKVTVKASLDDLFDDPSKFEYEIEY